MPSASAADLVHCSVEMGKRERKRTENVKRLTKIMLLFLENAGMVRWIDFYRANGGWWIGKAGLMTAPLTACTTVCPCICESSIRGNQNHPKGRGKVLNGDIENV